MSKIKGTRECNEDHLPYRTYAEVNISELKKNTKKVRALLKEDCKLLSVLKADGYGHGAVEIARAIEDLSDWFAVASFEEAKELRDHGIRLPLLVFGFVDDSNLQEAAEKDITCSCLSYEYAQHIQTLCKEKNIRLSMHVKVDTGFHRLGIECREGREEEAYQKIREIYEMENLVITGIYTHFATAGSKVEEDITFLHMQAKLFKTILNRLKDDQISVGISHCCNSKATLTNPEYHMDMVRVGLYLYGLGNEDDLSYLQLEPIVKWKARIYAIKDVDVGESVGYSRMYRADKRSKIGVVSLGFADGYARSLWQSEHIYVLVHGQRTKILGKICMDVMMIDLTDIEEVKCGDMVTVLGRDGQEVVSANLLGKEIKGTAVEITCGMGKRVKRIYTYE